MNEEKKKNKKKVLTFYLILLACVLVITAITLTTIFAVNDWGNGNIAIDSGNTTDQTGSTDNTGNKDDTGGNTADVTPTPADPDDEKDEPASKDDTFALPVQSLNLVTAYEFGKDVTLGHYHFHSGLDLAADAGTEVMACLDGTVTAITEADGLDGATVTISHDNGLTTVYTFIDKAEGLEVGASVTRGQVIGTVSEACGKEYKVGAHLHFEVFKNGEATDPEEYLDVSAK